MTVRLASCRELAEDHAAVNKLSSLFLTLEKSATPTSLLFPWFPGRDKKARNECTKDMYIMLSKYVNRRRKADVQTLDAIDVMIAQGFNNDNIVGVSSIPSLVSCRLMTRAH
jgi:hypothetical protein